MGGRSAEVERGRGKLGTSLGRSASAHLPTPLPMGPRRRAGVPSPTGASTELLRIIWAPDAAGGVALGVPCRLWPARALLGHPAVVWRFRCMSIDASHREP